jgi:hypothetical protein
MGLLFLTSLFRLGAPSTTQHHTSPRYTPPHHITTAYHLTHTLSTQHNAHHTALHRGAPLSTWDETCRHNEVVQVVYDPAVISYVDLLTMFWQSHDPTQGMGQGNDRGTQYRSGIYCYAPGQQELAEASKAACVHPSACILDERSSRASWSWWSWWCYLSRWGSKARCLCHG